MQSPKILFLVNGGGLGGAEQVFLRQAQYLKEQGCQVWRGAVNDQFRQDQDLLNFAFANLYDRSAYRRLINFCQAQNISHIYATLDQAIFIARVLKIFVPTLKIIIRESGMASRKSMKIKLADIFFNILVSKIIAVSQDVSKSLISYQPFYKNKILVLNNGVDIYLRLDTLLQQRNNSSSHSVVILHVGSMHNDNKGQANLLRVFKNIVNQRPSDNLSLWLVGDGKKRNQLENLAKDLQLLQLVKFWGEVDRAQLNSLYEQADIFVLNSQNEGCPNVVLEAMSFALPVVSSRVGGINEILQDQKSGLIFPVSDQANLERLLLKLIDDKAMRLSLGQNAYNFVQKNLTWQQQNIKLKSLFIK